MSPAVESTVVNACQVCASRDLEQVLFLGYLPPVNHMRPIGTRPSQEPFFATELLRCPACTLVQLGLIVDKHVLFPPEYPYTSGTTRILRDNFADLHRESSELFPLRRGALVVDIGSNDGTLLSNWHDAGHRVHGIEPTDMGRLARERGIATTTAFMSHEIAKRVRDEHGPARLITATNVFAHMDDIHEIIAAMLELLDDDGVIVTESHYLLSLVETVQYDTVYHEHLRYYSLASLSHLFGAHGLEMLHARQIPTHGGSVRVYVARQGTRSPLDSVSALVESEQRAGIDDAAGLSEFARRVVASKHALNSLLADIVARGERIVGISAPSRATTLLRYVGIDERTIGAVLEIPGSHKIGKYMPGSLIPVLDEAHLFEEQPEYALLLSWHIADELIPKLRARGYGGRFIVPLPSPRIVD